MLRLSALKILILENQMIIAADVSLQLSKLGYQVIGINTCAEDALKTIENNRPDIVLMNLKTQNTAKRLRTAGIILKTFQIPVIFLSAHTDGEVFEQIIPIQPYAFITKPFDIKDLQRGINTALQRMTAEGNENDNSIHISAKTIRMNHSDFPKNHSESEHYRSDSSAE
jgi:AmiR/NasT family two-component response regulator